MKAENVTLLGALALTLFAAGCDPGPTVLVPGGIEQSLSGSSFIIGVDPAGKVTTAHHLIATGSPGTAHVEALLEFKQHDPHGVISTSCDKRFPYGASLISMTWVQVYDDGSAFTGAVETESLAGSVVCTDGRNFHIEVRGPIVETAGPRFKSFGGGTWTAMATIGHALTIGRVTADFKEKEEKTGPRE